MVVVIGLAPTWERPDARFDEGFALAYGVQVLEGDLPHRDFVSFYGPANPFLVAGAFAIGGVSQDSERVLGMLYRLLIVLGAAGLGLTAGCFAALVVGLAAVVLLLPLGVPAFAAPGALGFGLAALALLLVARRAGTDQGGWPAGAAGLLAGLSLLIRPDFGVVVLLAAIPLLLGAGRRKLRVAAAGFLPALLTLIVDLLLVGPARTSRVLRDVYESGPGRRLPFAPFADEPLYAEASRIFVLTVLAAGAALGVAVLARRRSRDALDWRAVTALAVFSVGLMPHALSRLDYAHGVMPLVPAGAALMLAAPLAIGEVGAWGRRLAAPAISAAFVATALLLAPQFVQATARNHANRLLGRIPPPEWIPTGHAGRTFGLDPATARDVQPIVDAAVRERLRGARTLFVGPRDLRRINVNDGFLYYVLADYQPASYYMELNPWTANRPGSGLAEELERADVLILNSEWDIIVEPNESKRYGSAAPNRVVAERFCSLRREGTFELLRRCR